jgi:hypothetical protein
MNLYFIVEGRRTEKKVYPAWLSFLIPKFSQVQWAYQAKNENYFLFNGNGFPALLHNHLVKSIEEINELGNFNYLVLILDTDESTINERIQEVTNFVANEAIKLKNCELVVIPQNRCIETWFLGNRLVFKSNPKSSNLVEFIRFYNVKNNDPEKMGVYKNYNTHSQFHADYCTEYLRERNIRYSKNHPNGVVDKPYLDELVNRLKKTRDLNSFRLFIEFCNMIKHTL